MSKQPVFRYAIRAKFRQSENQLMRTDQRSDDGLDTRIRDRRDRFSHSHKCQPFASCRARRCDKRAASAIRTNMQRASTLIWLQVRGGLQQTRRQLLMRYYIFRRAFAEA